MTRRGGPWALWVPSILTYLLVACGGGGGGSAPPLPPAVQSSNLSLRIAGVVPSSVSGSIAASDPSGLPLQYSIAQQPKVGTVTLNASAGTFTYAVTGFTSATTDQFKVTVSNGKAASIATVSLGLLVDPLLEAQWHIKNTGANAFSSVRPAAGNDMNVTGAWTAGYSGKGVKVAVIDSGLEVAHEDLSTQVDLANSINFLTGTSDPSRSPADVGFDHGTAVAGIIGAAAFNGKGGRGAAYNARLRGYNYLAPGAGNLANYARAFGGDPRSADNDIFNASFDISPVSTGLPTFSTVFQEISANLLTLRNGLGGIQIIAAGNEFVDWRRPPSGLCTAANRYGVSCGDPAHDERRGGYTPIIVGALNADGIRSSYSTTGSALWISAPGGEYGVDSGYVNISDLSDPTNAVKPAIVTTSRTGCANSAAAGPVNALDSKGSNSNASLCQYTAMMNGTSAAAPNVAATAALMLEANPKLGWRDVRYILAKTAKKVDAAFSGRLATDIVPGATVVLEQGWVTNKAGWSFSNWYGFGAVDAAAAVAMAKAYTNYLPPIKSNEKPYLFVASGTAIVPAMSMQGYRVVFEVSETFSVVEHVTVFVNIVSSPGMLCNQVELVSPSGTKSILMHAANGFSNASLVDVRFLSNAFYGEPVNGSWTLTFFDFCGGSVKTNLSLVRPQALLLSGH